MSTFCSNILSIFCLSKKQIDGSVLSIVVVVVIDL